MLVRVFRITALKPTARAPGISSCTYHLVPSDALLLSSRLIPAFLFFATLCTFLHPRQLLSRTAPQSYVPLLPQEDEVFFPLLERSLQHTESVRKVRRSCSCNTSEKLQPPPRRCKKVVRAPVKRTPNFWHSPTFQQ